MSDALGAGGPTYCAEAFRSWDAHREGLQPYFQEVYSHIGSLLGETGDILDVAGGEGYTHDVLPEASDRLVTLDVDGEALKRLQEKRPEARIAEANSCDMPFDDGTFEAAISINGIGRTAPTEEGAEQEAAELLRVLKPGGLLVYLYDLPFSLADFVRMLPSARSPSLYTVPVIDPASGNVDRLAGIRRRALRNTNLLRNTSGRAALEATEPLLEGDWMNNVYGKPMKTADHAQLFTRLVDEIQASVGASEVKVTPPIAPFMRDTEMAPFMASPDIERGVDALRIDRRLDRAHHIGGRAVSGLRVDELSFPHIEYDEAATSTRVSGRTNIFMVRKPEGVAA